MSLVFYPKSQRAHRSESQPRCSVADCTAGRYARGLCTMHYTRLRRDGSTGDAGRLRGAFGDGSVNSYGYLVVHAPGHPLAEGRAQGKIEAHRVILYESLGEGPHPCHWCDRMLPWRGAPGERICVDHLDFDKLNNSPSNLVPSCLDCNTKRVQS